MLSARRNLEQAFFKLPLRRTQLSHVRSMIDVLMPFYGKGNLKVPAQFLGLSRAGTSKELERLARAAEVLSRRLESLHQPSVLALADQGQLRHEVVRVLSHLINGARSADLRPVPDKFARGRPKKIAAEILVQVLAKNYEVLTGKDPTIATDPIAGKAYGPFLTLTADVFKALGVAASAEATVRKVLCKSKGGKASKRSP